MPSVFIRGFNTGTAAGRSLVGNAIGIAEQGLREDRFQQSQAMRERQFDMAEQAFQAEQAAIEQQERAQQQMSQYIALKLSEGDPTRASFYLENFEAPVLESIFRDTMQERAAAEAQARNERTRALFGEVLGGTTPIEVASRELDPQDTKRLMDMVNARVDNNREDRELEFRRDQDEGKAESDADAERTRRRMDRMARKIATAESPEQLMIAEADLANSAFVRDARLGAMLQSRKREMEPDGPKVVDARSQLLSAVGGLLDFTAEEITALQKAESFIELPEDVRNRFENIRPIEDFLFRVKLFDPASEDSAQDLIAATAAMAQDGLMTRDQAMRVATKIEQAERQYRGN